jgi:plasmid stability protein
MNALGSRETGRSRENSKVALHFGRRPTSKERECTRNPCYTDFVANLTLAIDDELLRKARIRALELGTSVNAMVREHLDHIVSGDDRAKAAMRRLLSQAAALPADVPRKKRDWTRDDLYEDRLGKWTNP